MSRHLFIFGPPSRTGYVSLEDYMSFVIAHETENVESNKEVEIAFQAITSGGDKPYVTREELFQVCVVCACVYIIPLSSFPFPSPPRHSLRNRPSTVSS